MAYAENPVSRSAHKTKLSYLLSGRAPLCSLGRLASELPPSRPPPLALCGVAATWDFPSNIFIFFKFEFKNVRRFWTIEMFCQVKT